MHDGTVSKLHSTRRIASRDLEWLEVIRSVVEELGRRVWIYREGRTRSVHVVEFGLELDRIDLRTLPAKAAYARGYFDAEGGIPRKPTDRFYIQMVQNDQTDLREVRGFLQELGVPCGRVHNPSAAVDPNYWRFYVRSCGHDVFARRVGSWNPRKRVRLVESCNGSQWSLL
ncbi:MAG: LAGLIDADG family homing endonuclease [Actinomycetota bacterium]